MSPHFGIAAGQYFAFDATRILTVCVVLALVVTWSRRFEHKETYTDSQDSEDEQKQCVSTADEHAQDSEVEQKRYIGTADEHERSHEMMIDDDDDENCE